MTARTLLHNAYLEQELALEKTRARGKDDFMGVDNNLGARELELDIRECRRIVEPARLGVNDGWYKETCARLTRGTQPCC